MKTFLFISLSLISLRLNTEKEPDLWLRDIEVAKVQAKAEKKPILMSFAGSDWCRPCIMLTKEVFENEEFIEYAKDNLVLVLLDFPRLKKNQLTEEQTKHNEKLAAKYNTNGEFPLVVIIDAEGKVIAKTGYQKGGAENFINYLESVL